LNEALGVSCLKLGAIIPVLEYFKRDRMKALVITRLGTVIGASATIGIMFADNLSWRTLFRYVDAINNRYDDSINIFPINKYIV
jgi:hypothetical protein